jgi:uncharacterized protein DUF3800
MGDEFMTVGGIALRRSRAGEITQCISKLKEDHKTKGEIKWRNARKNGQDIRKAFIDYLAKLVSDNHVHFHLRFSPMNEYEHHGERHIFDTVSRSFYQLLLHRTVRYYGKDCEVYVRPDNGECTRLLPGLKDALNLDGEFRYRTHADCIQNIIPLDSRNEPLLQLLDVSVGALSAHRNSRHLREESGPIKRELAQHAFKAFNLKSLNGNRDDGCKFSIWNVIPKKRKTLPKTLGYLYPVSE